MTTTERPTEVQAARALTEFLTSTRDRYGSSSTSQIEQAVQVRIATMCREMADEVVRANPDVVAVLRSRLEQTVAAVLRDDRTLDEMITKAVASALAKYRDPDL